MAIGTLAGEPASTWFKDALLRREQGLGRMAVDKKVKVGYEGGMMNTSGKDPISLLIEATFGAGVLTEDVGAAEAANDEVVEARDVEAPTIATATVEPSDLPKWWKYNLDGTPRKRCQAPEVLKGLPHGETRQRETDLLVLKALHAGAESLVEVVAQTGCVKVTCVRSFERLVKAGRVVQSKAAPSGKRGRPAFVYRPTTEAEVPTGG